MSKVIDELIVLTRFIADDFKTGSSVHHRSTRTIVGYNLMDDYKLLE